MRLSAWRGTFLWLAISACGAPGWTTHSASPKVSVLDVPLFAGASYIARVEQGDFGSPGLQVQALKGTLRCEPSVALLGRRVPVTDPDVVAAAKTCPPEIAAALAAQGGFLFVVDGSGPRWLTQEQVRAAIAPIDTPAKAALAAWVAGHYLGWSDGDREYGGLEDAHVRAVGGGYEVATGAHSSTNTCGTENARETIIGYRVVVFVAASGAVRERERTEVSHHDIADPCHPHGRRPAGFVARRSDGTVRGLLHRLMHDEAESVRAFERIARELRAHGAPAELIAAAEQAARDERDHAERCAALIGERAVIARDALPVRPLLACALDNAREGCVGETYAALAAVVQARDAEAPAVRAHFAAIAIDELAHAALAHALADWFDRVLSEDERRIVATARAAAVAELRASFPDAASPAMRALGMPAGADARRLLDVAAAA